MENIGKVDMAEAASLRLLSLLILAEIGLHNAPTGPTLLGLPAQTPTAMSDAQDRASGLAAVLACGWVGLDSDVHPGSGSPGWGLAGWLSTAVQCLRYMCSWPISLA